MDLDISLDYGLTLLAALLIGTGFVLQQQSAQREPASRFLSLKLITDLLRQPRWLAGIGAMICGQVLAAWSIGNLSLAFVEPLLTTNLVFALILAVPIAKASLRFWEIFGAAVLCTGVALLSAARSAKPIGLSFGSVTHWPAAAVIAGIAFAAVHAGRLHPGRARAMLTGAAAGLVFGIQDALTRQTLEILSSNGAAAMFTTWAPYALVGAGATGIWLMQSAFNSGPLPLSLPAIAAGEPLVGIMLGILVFGDRIQITPGELALQAGGIVALVVGVIIVGRAPALSQLRGWTPPSLPHITGALPTIPARPRPPARPGRRQPATPAPNAPRHPQATIAAEPAPPASAPRAPQAAGATEPAPAPVAHRDLHATEPASAASAHRHPQSTGATSDTQGTPVAPGTSAALGTPGTLGTPGAPGRVVPAGTELDAALGPVVMPGPTVVPESGNQHGNLRQGDAHPNGRAATTPGRITDGSAEQPQP